MKKALKRLAIGLLVELPLVAASSHLSVRVKQLATNHTDEEIKAMLAEKFSPIITPLVAAAVKVRQETEAKVAAQAQKAATASGDYHAHSHHAGGF
jgi:hypothetical protein